MSKHISFLRSFLRWLQVPRPRTRRLFLGTLLTSALLGSFLVAGPASAGTPGTINSNPSNTYGGTNRYYFNPTSKSAGYIEVNTNYRAYDGTELSGAPLCDLEGSVEWTVNLPANSTLVNGTDVQALLKNTLADMPALYKSLMTTNVDTFEFPAANNWAFWEGNITLKSQVLPGWKCSQVVDTPTTDKTTLWSQLKLGIMSSAAYNAGFFAVMFIGAASGAYLYPTLILNNYMASGLSALASAAANVGSTLITTHGDTTAALAAAGLGACITAFTEIPYLNFWEKMKAIAKATLARRTDLQNVAAVTPLFVELQDPNTGGGTLAQAVASTTGTGSIIGDMMQWGVYGDLYGQDDTTGWVMVEAISQDLDSCV